MNMEAESIRSRAESSGGWVKLKTVTEMRQSSEQGAHSAIVRLLSSKAFRSLVAAIVADRHRHIEMYHFWYWAKHVNTYCILNG